MASKRLRQVALALALAWTCWWVFFETAEAFEDRQFTQAVLFFVAMFGAVALAWKWPVTGAVVLIAEGLVSIAMFAPGWGHRFRISAILMLFAMMPLPPLVSGGLLLLSRRRGTPRPPAASI
jgi:hypothetical protein